MNREEIKAELHWYETEMHRQIMLYNQTVKKHGKEIADILNTPDLISICEKQVKRFRGMLQAK